MKDDLAKKFPYEDLHQPKHRKLVPLAKLKTAKTRHDPLQGVSSWALIKELVRRHIMDIQVFAFWVLVASLVLYKARII